MVSRQNVFTNIWRAAVHSTLRTTVLNHKFVQIRDSLLSKELKSEFKKLKNSHNNLSHPSPIVTLIIRMASEGFVVCRAMEVCIFIV